MALSANLLPRLRAFPPSLYRQSPCRARSTHIKRLQDCNHRRRPSLPPSLPPSLAGPLFVFGQRWRGIDCHTIDSVRHDDAGAKPDPPREEGAAPSPRASDRGDFGTPRQSRTRTKQMGDRGMCAFSIRIEREGSASRVIWRRPRSLARSVTADFGSVRGSWLAGVLI